MGGGLMQLVAYGAQDLFLTGTPEVTFWRAVTKRHTNFATEQIEQVFHGSVGWGKRISCTVSRNGDLVNDMILEITVKQTGPTWYPAEAIIKEIELELGGQKLDRHYSDWWRIYDELFRSGEQKEAYKRMTNFSWTGEQSTGQVTRKLYLPLIFFFNKDPSLALPLVQLQFHELKLHITTASDYASLGLAVDLDIKLYATFVFLDVEERKKFAASSTETLIEQLQFNGDEAKANNIRLTFNHPVKYLVWVMTHGSSAKHGLYNLSAPNKYFNSGVTVGMDSLDDMYNDCFAPIASAKLSLNGHDRFSERSGSYFNEVIPMQYCGTRPQAGIYMYSFANEPRKHQPTGSANFSRIDNATLNLKYKTYQSAKVTANAVTLQTEYGNQWGGAGADFSTVKVFCVNWNVLRIVSGMGGLAFSN